MNALEAAHWKALEEIVAYAATVPAPIPQPGVTTPPAPVESTAAAAGGGIDFMALARCESGTDLNANPDAQGGYRTGLFGIEAGRDIGYLSRAEQEQWVREIYAAHGAGAWGPLCRSAFHD